MVMDSSEDDCENGNFGFAFNNSNFSDRVLCIHIFPESSTMESTLSPSALFDNRVRTVPCNLANNYLSTQIDVASCMRHCSRLLTNLPMTPEFLLVYLDLPSTILMAEDFQPLTFAAKQFYAMHYKDITKFQDEILSLPLADVEAIIGSDDLQVTSEDEVYQFVLKWARAQYPEIEDRREIIQTRLAKLIRYPYMLKLNDLLDCYEFDPLFAVCVVDEAVCFQTEGLPEYIHGKNFNLSYKFRERAYNYRFVKMVKFQKPHPRVVVYLDLKRAKCASLFPSGTFYSQIFRLGGQRFYLFGECNMEQQSFRLYLAIMEKEAVSSVFHYEFTGRLRPDEEFVSGFKGRYVCTGAQTIGLQCLFDLSYRQGM